MAKAIKHITAGLLNYEILGTVPEGTSGRTRIRRGEPTSRAMQFYNDKCSWRELELLLAANFGAGAMVITATFDNDHLPDSKEQTGDCFGRYVRRVRAARKKRGEELRYVYSVEGWHRAAPDSVLGDDRELEDRRFHVHFVVNGTGPGMMEELRSLWPYGGYLRAEPFDIHYVRELAKYMTKEAREFGRAKVGERSWRASRNLTPYQVEYIEIPTDSVTLAPPAGAVDWEAFTTANPYGFAPCVGARYLLWPSAPNPGYSYTRGRRKPNT